MSTVSSGAVQTSAESERVPGVGPVRSHSQAARAVRAAGAAGRWAGGGVLLVHGVIHLMGVALMWKLGQPGELRYADMAPAPGSGAGLAVGAVWLTCAALFVLSGALVATRHARWRAVALAAVVLSVPVLGPSASMAAVGLAADGVILLAVILTWPARQIPGHQPGQES